jgi:hypothetical protein
MWTLEFFDVGSGDLIGRVQYTPNFDGGGTLAADPPLRSFIDGMTADEVLGKYDGWSNGYVAVRRPGQPHPRPAGGAVRVTPVAERDEALREHLEGTHFFDEEAGELMDDVQTVPSDPTSTSDDDDEA